MKVLFIAAFTLFSMPSAFAQDPGSETVLVTGGRIFENPFGPIAFSGGPVDRPRPCAEPRCGEEPDDPGSAATTVQQKTANNKKAKEKAKNNKDKLETTIISDQSSIEKLFAWMKGITVDVGGFFNIEITTKEGTKIKGQGCAQYHTKLNPQNTDSDDYCVQREFNNETIQRANGTFENQLNLTYTIYNACYWEKKCGLEIITFIAGSENELKGFLN
jgi:hypothetical protein